MFDDHFINSDIFTQTEMRNASWKSDELSAQLLRLTVLLVDMLTPGEPIVQMST